jgi:hypothetical protein
VLSREKEGKTRTALPATEKEFALFVSESIVPDA